MFQAYAMGLLDFRRARPRDPIWKRKLMAGMLAARVALSTQMQWALFFQNLALLANSLMVQAAAKDNGRWFRHVDQARVQLIKSLFPYAKIETASEEEEQRAHRLYKLLFGDYTDPKWLAEQDRKVQKIRKWLNLDNDLKRLNPSVRQAYEMFLAKQQGRADGRTSG